MADQAYIIPLRNDLDGMAMQVTDLHPSDSQRNYIYDPPAQAGYLKYSFDTTGATVVNGDAFVSGSLNTSPLAATADDDTTGGGADVVATTVTQFGLLAYIMDRVQPGGLAAATANIATPAEALSMADAILAIAAVGGALTLTAINAALAGVVADTDLAGAGTSLSFGSVADILRILAGDGYRLPAFTILGDHSGGVALAFWAQSTRQVLVDAQDIVANGGTTFGALGEYIVRGETGFRDIRALVLSGSIRISAGEGVLAGFADAAFDYLNPLFDYLGIGSRLPRARSIDGTVIPDTGVGAVCAVYDNAGNPLS